MNNFKVAASASFHMFIVEICLLLLLLENPNLHSVMPMHE